MIAICKELKSCRIIDFTLQGVKLAHNYCLQQFCIESPHTDVPDDFNLLPQFQLMVDWYM